MRAANVVGLDAGRAMVMGIVRSAFPKSIEWHEARRQIDMRQALRREDSEGANLPERGYVSARETLGKPRGEAALLLGGRLRLLCEELARLT